MDPELTELEFGGVPVLEIKPKGWQDNGKVLVYTHGGVYTMQSAKSSFPQGGLAAQATGMRVIAVDYTLAPHAKWQEVTDQVVTVFEELLKQGYAMKELILSDFVRLYQTMDTEGQTVKVDLYEDMPHVFQAVPGLPESELALNKVDAFLSRYLGR